MGFAKHRTFYIREGWLPKTLKLINEKPYIFTPANREEAIDELGVGKTMVAALRFWMQATGLTIEGRGTKGMIEQEITDLGKFILNHDPFFEDTKTLWLLHYKLVTQESLATSWYWFFNFYQENFFDQTSFITELKAYTKNNLKKEVAESSLKKDFHCFKNTYLYERKYSYQNNPEDILTSPLVDLELVTKNGKQGFQLNIPSFNKLSSDILYYVILNQYSVNENEQISFTQLLETENSIGKVFRLKRKSLLRHLEFLEEKGYLEIQRGFGHNLITLHQTNKFKVLEDAYTDIDTNYGLEGI
ncbi:MULTISPECIES: DUF4007 family protein [unclassified Candidatus Frackibacter]|uniref:DUF4007 family protein n=1 Tax=unclassified Candidatus Frackibacter TaxID=2648818 RepID=UPI00088A1E39|nr:MULTISPECIES: DUF4007 family protein [unclassified Candidatus Frackibacter]SDC27785.1 Protein of unknown function [Candidatus Frackibacter sp. WG11]SEM54677.1 Protein of unknown function [Candidatus Frackibacter sp. WG12]SFL53687.1 Protein of unknown function [Candidatus Frackibacter sp. WG13]